MAKQVIILDNDIERISHKTVSDENYYGVKIINKDCRQDDEREHICFISRQSFESGFYKLISSQQNITNCNGF